MTPRQLSLLDVVDVPTETEVDRLCRAFAEAVARGEYDENGYTPAEAKAARTRGTYVGVLTMIREGRLVECAGCCCWHAPGAHRQEVA